MKAGVSYAIKHEDGPEMRETLMTEMVAEATEVCPTARKVAGPSPNFVRRILVVDDNDTFREQLRLGLGEEPGVEVEAVGDGEQALRLLSERRWSLVLTDLRMPRLGGMELIQQVQERQLPVTVIVTTGHGNIDDAVHAIRSGAHDFLTKPVDLEQLRRLVRRALRERALRDELAHLREQLQRRHAFTHMVSKNPRMLQIFELINNLALTTATVLIQGETGTGKEEIARAIHLASHSRKGLMIAVNCAALPETLLESELFGHEKGAFTSAVSQRQGRFEMADGGTLFLDEIGDVPPAMQVRLLRVLQERRFERVGGTQSIEVDVRVIAATNRPLERVVRQGKFREDLYYRLNVVKIELPPLRERPEDIPLLATHFVDKYTRRGEAPRQIAPAAMEVLMRYRWPGNIRELENAIERACVTCRDSVIGVENLPPELSAPPAARLPVDVDLDRPLPELLRQAITDVERQYIRKALKKTRGNVGRCARLCGLSRRSLTYKIAEYGIDRKVFRDV
jgi:DNA-binding NtrC family response regulator